MNSLHWKLLQCQVVWSCYLWQLVSKDCFTYTSCHWILESLSDKHGWLAVINLNPGTLCSNVKVAQWWKYNFVHDQKPFSSCRSKHALHCSHECRQTWICCTSEMKDLFRFSLHEWSAAVPEITATRHSNTRRNILYIWLKDLLYAQQKKMCSWYVHYISCIEVEMLAVLSMLVMWCLPCLASCHSK